MWPAVGTVVVYVAISGEVLPELGGSWPMYLVSCDAEEGAM